METKELIKLINACKRSGVTELNVGDVAIKLEKKGDSISSANKVSEIPIPSADELKTQKEDALFQANIEASDEDLSTLHVEDPSRFEELLLSKELEDSGPKKAFN